MLPAVRIGIIEPATNSMRHAMEAVLPVFRSVSLRPSRLAPRQSPAVGTILDSRAQFAAYTPLCGAQSPSHALLPLELISPSYISPWLISSFGHINLVSILFSKIAVADSTSPSWIRWPLALSLWFTPESKINFDVSSWAYFEHGSF